MGGVWIALMHFNLLLSVLIALVLAHRQDQNRRLAGDMRGMVVQLAACVLAAAIYGLAFSPQTTMLNIVGSLPLLIGYPLAMSVSAHSLTRMVRYQNQRLARMHQENPAELLDSTH